VKCPSVRQKKRIFTEKKTFHIMHEMIIVDHENEQAGTVSTINNRGVYASERE
jgi:hypothetical protein